MSTPNPEHSARVQWIPLGLLASWRSISLRWNAQTAKRRLGSPLVRSLVVQTVCRSGPEEVTVAPADSGDYELSYPFLCSVSMWNWMFWGHSFALQYWWKCSKTGLGLERREKKKKKTKQNNKPKRMERPTPLNLYWRLPCECGVCVQSTVLTRGREAQLLYRQQQQWDRLCPQVRSFASVMVWIWSSLWLKLSYFHRILSTHLFV